jgi:hypothetical protein
LKSHLKRVHKEDFDRAAVIRRHEQDVRLACTRKPRQDFVAEFVRQSVARQDVKEAAESKQRWLKKKAFQNDHVE